MTHGFPVATQVGVGGIWGSHALFMPLPLCHLRADLAHERQGTVETLNWAKDQVTPSEREPRVSDSKKKKIWIWSFLIFFFLKRALY